MEKRRLVQKEPEKSFYDSSSSDPESNTETKKIIERKQARTAKQIQTTVNPLEKIRKIIYHILYGGYHPYDYITQYVIVGMVILTVVLFLLSTVDEIQEKASLPLRIIEIVAVTFFTIEFFLRLWCCVEIREYKRRKYPHWKSRLWFLIRLSTIIDILAVFPFWIQLPLSNKFFSVDFLSAVRILRVLLLFKTEKYTRALQILAAVIRNNRELLTLNAILAATVFICMSTALYFSEYERNPQRYSSIPATMYTALLVLTALDVPPQQELSALGKVIVGISAVISILMIAVPAGLLGWGFENLTEKFVELRNKKKKIKEKQQKQKAMSKGGSLQSPAHIQEVDTDDEGGAVLSSNQMLALLDEEENADEGKDSPSSTRPPKHFKCPHCHESILVPNL